MKIGISSINIVSSLIFGEGGGGSPLFPNGNDGALVINGTTVKILAGSVKQYSSISIINNGILQICNSADISGNPYDVNVNSGVQPTIIGCKGNCTINTGGKIIAVTNASGPYSKTGGTVYSKTAPAGSVVPVVSFTNYIVQGGNGGGFNGSPGAYGDLFGFGCGGGSDNGAGGNTYGGYNGRFGESGSGSNGFHSSGGAPLYGSLQGFGISGNDGSSEGVKPSGGGGSGGTRAYNGGCIYLQVNGTLSVSGTVIYVSGGNGGSGGSGSYGYYTGGSGAGGGGGGSGGKLIVRYHAGAFSGPANASTGSGNGGNGGYQGYGPDPGPYDGSSGSPGNVGSYNIATF